MWTICRQSLQFGKEKKDVVGMVPQMHYMSEGQGVAGCARRGGGDRDIKLEKPTEEELRRWHAMSGLPLKRFFNTSGLQYKALGLKDKLPGMSEDAQFALLATDGMLVKRPILVGENFALTGFKEAEWMERLEQ